MPERLSKRQLQCLRMATQTDKAIARSLGISHHTVSLHIREAMRKLGAASRVEAMQRLADNPLYASSVIPEVAEPLRVEPVTAKEDRPPTRYRPPPGGLVNTTAIIYVFALTGGLAAFAVILWLGMRHLQGG